jgi:hypothetical protein
MMGLIWLVVLSKYDRPDCVTERRVQTWQTSFDPQSLIGRSEVHFLLISRFEVSFLLINQSARVRSCISISYSLLLYIFSEKSMARQQTHGNIFPYLRTEHPIIHLFLHPPPH